VARFNELGLSNTRIQCLLEEQRDRRISYDRITADSSYSRWHQVRFNRLSLISFSASSYAPNERAPSQNARLTVGKKPLASKYADANIV